MCHNLKVMNPLMKYKKHPFILWITCGESKFTFNLQQQGNLCISTFSEKGFPLVETFKFSIELPEIFLLPFTFTLA
jgi:hypothetical protein